MTNDKQEQAIKLLKASKHYAHNYFCMHETNSYKELKRGFEAGAKWAIENKEEVKIEINKP